MTSDPSFISPAPSRFRPVPLSPLGALTRAFEDTIRFLIRPFNTWRWIKLSSLCLLLGGGTPSAAFQWSLSALPEDIRLSKLLAPVREYVGRHPWLILLGVGAGLAIALILLYLRAAFRFLLVDAIFKRETQLRSSWKGVQRLARSYFLWLMAALMALGGLFAGVAVVAFPYTRSHAASGAESIMVSIALVALLAAVVLLGLLMALAITLTDDLVVPVMYAEGLPLPAAWRKLWVLIRKDSSSFLLYILLRFVVSVAVGVAVLFVLFPVLVALFSSAIVASALVMLALRVVGLLWVWNVFTILLATAALTVLISILLVLLSVAGMPGQVFLQGFGMRFITSRVPAMEALWRHYPAARKRI